MFVSLLLFFIRKVMESAKIEYIKENIYIPQQQLLKRPSLPERHPSLILHDQIADAGVVSQCGCKGGKCIKESASWIYKENGEVKETVSKDCVATEGYHFKNLIHDSIGRQL